jgi:hypothetical protein
LSEIDLINGLSFRNHHLIEQYEETIVDAVCNAASDASDETREAALQWLLAQHHDEVLMLVCDLRVESMCFRVDCFLAFSFVQPTFIRFVRFASV